MYGSISPQGIATDCLNSSKFLVISDAFESLECSTPQIRDTFVRMNQQHLRMADEWYRLMSRKGWYQVPQARPEIQSQVASHINTMGSQIMGSAYTQASTPGYQVTGQTSQFPNVIPPHTV